MRPNPHHPRPWRRRRLLRWQAGVGRTDTARRAAARLAGSVATLVAALVLAALVAARIVAATVAAVAAVELPPSFSSALSALSAAPGELPALRRRWLEPA